MKKSITSKLKKTINIGLSAAIVFSGSLPLVASAQAICNEAEALEQRSEVCVGVAFSGQTVVYPRLNWEDAGSMDIASLSEGLPGADLDTSAIPQTDEVYSMANKSALAVGYDGIAKRLVSAATALPSNIPYVLGRYDPLNKTLKVDLIKVERGMLDGQAKIHLMAADFTPGHGNMWKANRAYISPENYNLGTLPGVNPFEAFEDAGAADSSVFYNINLTGAHVVMGHAMRMTGAPYSLLGELITRMDTRSRTQSNIFRKKITTEYLSLHKYRWYMGMPKDVMSRTSTLHESRYCVTSPDVAGDCPIYQTAAAGVHFEHFEGGTLNEDETEELLETVVKRKWNIGIAIVLGVLSFGVGSLIGGLGAASASATVAGAGVSTGVSMGVLGSVMVNAGMITAATTIAGAIAIETAVIAAGMALGGAFNGIGGGPGGYPYAGISLPVGIGKELPTEYTKDTERLILKAQTLTKVKNAGNLTATTKNGAAAKAAGPTYKSFTMTVTGGCDLSKTSAECGEVGSLPRTDDFRETYPHQFVRDNHTNIKRDLK